jgi:hypothetical protein
VEGQIIWIRNANPAERANRVKRGQTILGKGKPYRKEGEIHGERKRKPCVEKVNHVEVDHVEGGGKPWRRSEQTTWGEEQTMEVKSCA